VNQHWQQHIAAGEKSLQALQMAIADVENEQDNDFAIPRRFSVTMREIWTLQGRFDSRSGARPYRFLEQPRFRAAFDFMSLRAEAGELPASLVEWWEAFQRGDQAEREALINEAKNSGADEPRKSAVVVAPAIAAVPRVPVEGERPREPGLCRSGE
jgi:poly(A) polymerase